MAFYQVEVTGQVRKEIRRLPGNVRQRVIRLLRSLEQVPHPHNSKLLDTAKFIVTPSICYGHHRPTSRTACKISLMASSPPHSEMTGDRTRRSERRSRRERRASE